MRILLAGSGTGGPVIPLLAVANKIKEQNPEAEFLFVGTKHGPEADFVKHAGFKFESVPAGKLRRYFSLKNFAAPFEVVAGFFRALRIIRDFKPDVVFGVGGYVCVPVFFAAFLRRKKIVIHQQDSRPTLTNKILAPFATKITVTFEWSLKDFYSGSGILPFKKNKVVWTGNPFREELLIRHSEARLKKIRADLGIVENLPVILVFGGATGAAGINNLLNAALPELVRFAYVIHGTGGAQKQPSFEHPRYFPKALITNMPEVYAVSDIVVCRAGLSTITELSVLKKNAIVIPMLDSHQVDNALILKYSDAAIVLNQDYLTAPELISIIRKLLFDHELQMTLSQNIGKIMPHDATAKLAKIIIDLCRR